MSRECNLESDTTKAELSKINYIFNSCSDSIISTDTSGIITMWNKGSENIFKYSKSEAIGQPISILFNEKDYHLIETFISQLQQGENIDKVELTLLRKDKNEVHVLCSLSAIEDDSGKIIELVGISKDVTEQKESAKNLLESESNLRTILHKSPFPVAVLDEQCNEFLFISNSAHQLFGHNPKTAEEWFQLAYPDPDYRQKIISRWEPQMEEAKKSSTLISTGEYEVTCKDGSVKTCEIYAQFIIGNLIIFLNDITERKRSEEAQIETNKRLRLTAESAQEGLWEWDFSTDKVSFDKLALEMLGYDEDFETKTSEWWLSQIHPEEQPLIKEQLEDFISNKNENFSVEFRMKKKDGQYIWITSNSRIMRVDDKGMPSLIVGTNRDITQQVEKLRRIKKNELILTEVGKMAKIGGWEMDIATGKATWTKTVYDIVEIDIDQDIPGLHEHIYYYLPKYRTMIADAMENLIKNDIPFDFEAELKTAKGNIIWCRAIGRAEWSDGECIKVFGTFQDITDRKRIEEALYENQDRYKKAQAMGHVGNWEFDPINEKFWGSDEARRIYGFDLDNHKFSIDEVENCILERERVHQALVDLIESDKKYDLEFDIITHDKGIRKTIRSIAEVERDESGNPIKITGVISDLTDQKKNERIVKEQKAQFSTLLETLPDLVWLKDPDGVYLACNRRFEDFFGDIVGKSDYDFMDKEDADFFRINDKAAAEAGGPTINEEEIVFKSDGHKEVLETIKTPMYDSNGNLLGVLGIGRDITERKNAAEKLKESENLFRNLFENSPDLVTLIDLDGKIIDVNRTASNLPKEDVIGTNVPDYLTPEQKMEFEKAIKKAVRSNQSQSYNSFTKNPDGTTNYWYNRVSPAILNGKIDRLIINSTDVSEMRRLQQLEFRAERLETAGIIAGQVAHDFNNLLGPLVAYPDFIKEELPIDNVAHGYLEDMKKAAIRIADINNDLLTLSRRGHFNLEILDVNAVAQQAINDINTLNDKISIDIKLDDGILPIKGGSAQIHRMINNILNNSIDAMGGIGNICFTTENYYSDDTSIKFGIVPKGEYVKCTISDNGCGMPEELMEKIFDPFFTTKKAGSKRGSGLGLSVVQAVMNDHRGFIDIDSKIGSGTSFYLYFPVCRDTVIESEVNEIDEMYRNATILVIDDDDMQRQVTKALLEKSGFKVYSVPSGEDAVEYCKENEPDLLVLDMIMPDGIDGAETYQLIKDIHKDQKAILLSGQSESDRVREAQLMGAGTFIRKPVTRSTLIKEVNQELERKVKC